ncbi:LuxR C-terminal-related transcriptional regulator [Streptomyces coryli]|uniref:LuxR C-terminal-related transcriptional regulator n=1 Tax=Streptomyces coryli TaxID=1128680 RepID=UPI0019D2852E
MRERALDKIARMAQQPCDLVTFWQEATEAIATTVPFYWAPCWYTLDPASLLVTSHYQPGLATFPAEWLAEEYYGDDVNRLADVVLSAAGIGTLHEATGGDPSATPRWRRNIALGGDQELIAGLRSRAGDVWGALGLYREPGQPMFDETDKRFVRALAPHLAEGARRALLLGEATDPEGPDAPGLLILTAGWEVESATPGVERWLRDLPDGDFDAGRLPSAVLALAGRALRTGEHPGRPGEVGVARILSTRGTWVVLHGACMQSGGPPRVAVIIEPAHPGRIYSLLMSAYGLTAREREVTRHILQGSSTVQIADDLVISVHTVRQHLKSIFGKAGVRSRRDLVAKVFYAHYETRLRDNEQRTLDGKPVRGGPAQGFTPASGPA